LDQIGENTMCKIDRFMMATGIVLGCLDSTEVRESLRKRGVNIAHLEAALRDVYLATLSEPKNGNGLDWAGEDAGR